MLVSVDAIGEVGDVTERIFDALSGRIGRAGTE